MTDPTGPKPSTKNYNLPLLYEAAERFNFIVDTRGPWPCMIKGMNAKLYTCHRDLLNFISVSPIVTPERFDR